MRPPARVLWLVKGLGRGGAEQLLLDLARTFDPATVRLDVGYVLAHKDALSADLAAAGVAVQCLAPHGARWAWPVRLRQMLKVGGYDVVHSHSPLVAAAARVLAPSSAALLHTEHNVWERYHGLTRWANAATIARNHRVYAVSQGVVDSIRRNTRRSSVPVELLVHGITPAGAVDDKAPHPLERLGLRPGPFTIGSVGNLTPKKDHDTLILALQQLHSTVPDARLVLVGGGPREDHLRDLVRATGVEQAVTFAGVRGDVRELLPGFDAFVMSSRYEGLSIALLEAMSAGLPSVVTAVGGMPEVVTSEHDGLLVPPGDVAAISTALGRLAGDRALRRRLGAAAERRSTEFGIAAAADTLTAAYVELSGRRSVVVR